MYLVLWEQYVGAMLPQRFYPSSAMFLLGHNCIILNRFRFACTNIVNGLVLAQLSWRVHNIAIATKCQQKRLRYTVMCLMMFYTQNNKYCDICDNIIQ